MTSDAVVTIMWWLLSKCKSLTTDHKSRSIEDYVFSDATITCKSYTSTWWARRCMDYKHTRRDS